MQKNTLISVIIPVRNGVNYLAEAIAGIRVQNVSSEIIVVDDGSTDETAQLAERLACIVLSQSPSGPSRARNAAANIAKGDFVLFLDHDDVLTEDALAALLTAFEAETDVVAAKLRDFVSPELPEAQAAMMVPRQKPYGGLLTGAYLFRRSALAQVGNFNERLTGGGEVVDFLMRCGEKGLVMKQIEYVSCLRRLHSTNTGRTKRVEQHKDYATTLRMKLLRNR